MRRLVILSRRMLLLVVAASLLVADTAGAALRSPRLQDDCDNGRTYSEVVIGAWRVEGCNKELEPQGDEYVRRQFAGTLEVNGMIVEGNSPLVATQEPDGQSRINKLHRDSA